MRQLLAAALFLFGAFFAHADQISDPLRLAWADCHGGQALNYAGLVVYHSGERGETSRISHMVVGGEEFESSRPSMAVRAKSSVPVTR